MGIWDVWGFLDQIPWDTFIEWEIACSLDPPAEERIDIGTGIVGSTLANMPILLGLSKGTPVPASNYMPKYDVLGESKPGLKPLDRQGWNRFISSLRAVAGVKETVKTPESKKT